jgi:hypothetical protein
MAVKQSITLAALALGLVACGGSASSPRAQALFLSGSPAPAGLTFASFGRAAINARGTVCFLAGWDGLRHRPEGLFLRQGDQVTPIARAGDPVPGSPGERFSFVPDYPDDFASFSMNGQDDVAFVVRQGLFLFSGGSVRPVVRIGDAVSGVPDEIWDEIDTVSLNNTGLMAFTGALRSVTDGTRQEGVFLVTGDTVQIILFDGDQLPDLDGALNSFAAVSLNDAGRMAVLATEGDDSIGCILLTSGNDTQAVAVEGNPAPGGTWSNLGSVALNNQDAVAFLARVATDADEHGGIYRASGGAVTPVSVPGQAVGSDAGEILGDYWGRPIIDDTGAIAFLAELAGSRPKRALLLAKDGVLSVLAAEAAPAPGGGSGTIRRFSGLSLGSMSPAGLVCGVSLAGAAVADTLVRYRLGGAPETLMTTDSSLPAGTVLTLADSRTPSRNVQARLNRSRGLVFAADVGGYGRALFRMGLSGPALLTPLGRTGGSYAGLRSVVAFDLNDASRIAFLGTRDEADQDTAILTMELNPQAAPRLITATDDGVPGTQDHRLVGFGPPAMDGGGGIFFAAVAQPAAGASPPDRSFLLRSRGDQLEVVAGDGQPVEGAGTLAAAPGFEITPTAPLFREIHVNAAGQVLFASGYLDQKTSAFNSNGLFLFAAGAVQAIALPGQTSPMPGGLVYTGFTSPRISDDGAVTFAATVAGGGRKPRAGLFRRDVAGAVTLAAAGDPVPGWSGESYRAFLDPAANAAAGVAFLALLDPPPSPGAASALLVSSGPSARTALRDGDPVDGAGSTSFAVDDRFPPAPLALQDDGSLLVAAQLRGSDAPDGLFLIHPG